MTWTIRTPIVDKHVSPVAAYAGVRAAFVRLCSSAYGGSGYGRGDADSRIVLVRRDTGTVVAPDAAVKILYGCIGREPRPPPPCRAGRARPGGCDFETSCAIFCAGTEIDLHRAAAPLSCSRRCCRS